MSTPMGAPMGAGGMPMPAPAAPAKSNMMPMVLGLVGGILALLGGLIGWLQIQACVLTICISVPMPPGISIASYDAILGMAPLLTVLFGLIGIVMVVLRKPMVAMIVLLMGILALVMCILFFVRAGALQSALQSVFPGGTGGSVSVGASIGLWLSLIGALLRSEERRV